MPSQAELSPKQRVAAGLQSPHWERYGSVVIGPLPIVNEQYLEPLPRARKRKPDGTLLLYDLITRGGERLIGYPDIPDSVSMAMDSSLHSGWIVKETDERGRERRVEFHQFAIAVWREKEPQENIS
jgi:hypothetical protein